MSYESNMHAARGSPRTHHGRRDHGFRNEYEDRQGSRRSIEGRRYRGEDNHGASRDPYAGSNGNRKPPRLSIEEAIGRLFNTLTGALNFYVNFKRDFDGETRGIRVYAGSELLDRLWMRKVGSIEGRTEGHHRSNTPGDEKYDQDRPPPETNFKSMQRELSDSFGIAVTASPSSGSRSGKPDHGPPIDRASLDRLKKKLHDAHQDIRELSEFASQRSGDTQALITEAELVLAYLDKSRDLWDPRGGNDPSGGQELQDHDGQGQDGGNEDGYPEEDEPGQ